MYIRQQSSRSLTKNVRWFLLLLALSGVFILRQGYDSAIANTLAALRYDSSNVTLANNNKNNSLQQQTPLLLSPINKTISEAIDDLPHQERFHSSPNRTINMIAAALDDEPRQQQQHSNSTPSLAPDVRKSTTAIELLSEQVSNRTNNNMTDAAFEEPSLHQQRQRLNTSQLLELLASNSLNGSQVPHLFPKPPSDSYDISSIYSQKAWLKFRNMMLTKGKSLSICVNGGSSSTGCCDPGMTDRYQLLFARHSRRRVTIVDRAHGARNSMHSVHLMHSFFPKQADIMLWEFAVNDATYHQFDNETVKKIEARNQLILWLDQVERVAKQRQSKPPFVILVYLWNSFPFVGSTLQPDLAYEAHRGVAEKYDFVVGHVNAGKYFASLWEPNVTKAYFLSDYIHPNSLGHHVIYYLMLDLLMDEQRQERPRSNPTTSIRPSYQWACGEETSEKRALQKLLVNRHVIASFTQEQPKNTDELPGMLLPQVDGDLKIENLGKSNPLRQDRKYSAVLPCCRDSILSFDRASAQRGGLMEGVQLVLHPNSTGLALYFDAENVTDKLIDCRNRTEWQCLFSDVYDIFLYWVVLDAPRNVSSISMCNQSPACNSTATMHQLSLQSMVVYGEDE